MTDLSFVDIPTDQLKQAIPDLKRRQTKGMIPIRTGTGELSVSNRLVSGPKFKQMKISIFWFRRDLRLDDNTALNHALNSGFPVLPIFIFDLNIIEELPQNDARIGFIYDSLFSINKKLNQSGSSLRIYKGKPVEVWKEIISNYKVQQVFINKDYEPYALERDSKVKSFLSENLIKLNEFKDQVIFEESEITKKDGGPYTIYTPYKNKWREQFDQQLLAPTSLVQFNKFYSSIYPFPSLNEIGFLRSEISVKNYDLSQLEQYASTRDLPNEDSTSYLSPHLRFGTVSIRQVIRQLNPEDETFLNELIWREFFMQILFHFPQVINQSFKPQYDGIKWRNDEKEFEQWCHGKTGYPLVDAGMRQLNLTGYMHNRVRMVTASFLCKHLLIDWRWGENYFAGKLLDYDLSSNNGNWQWAAGTGCDAAPYFRVFNPIEQLKKFDKDFGYVKKWIPEYTPSTYLRPMVEHKFARLRALDSYKEALQKR